MQILVVEDAVVVNLLEYLLMVEAAVEVHGALAMHVGDGGRPIGTLLGFANSVLTNAF